MNIGFVSYWFERGQAYVTKNVIQAVEDDCEVFVFARSDGVNAIGSEGEWDIPNLTRHEQYHIPQETLRNWVLGNDIDLVFFNEEYDFELVGMVKQLDVATIGIYYWELFNPEYTPYCNMVYDAIICPTMACFRRFGELGVNNIHHVKWGVDLDVFKPIEREANEVVRFFHPAGWGGLHERRGTQYVIEAFKLMENKAELLIHSQLSSRDHYVEKQRNVTYVQDTVPREMLIQMYQGSDVVVLPSKSEGLGLTFLEAIGCGLPIITVDAPPMNEFVNYGQTEEDTTGLCCVKSGTESYPDIFVEPAIVDVIDMAAKMDMLIDKDTLSTIREATIARRSEWDWKVNSLPLRDLILELGENAVGKKRKMGTSPELDTITALIKGTPPDADTRVYARFNKIMADPMLKGRVLDVGCKHGTLAFMLRDRLSDMMSKPGSIVGVDKDANNIKIAEVLPENFLMTGDLTVSLEFQQAEIKSLPFDDGSFDTVILAQVLEHVKDPEDLKELMRVLKPDGCLIITTPVGFAHYHPDHCWYFLPDKTYEMLRGGWFFMEQNNAPAFMKCGNVAPFGKFIEKYLGKSYGYQIYNNHESQWDSLEIYARVYKNGDESEYNAYVDFPKIEGDEIIEEIILYPSEMREVVSNEQHPILYMRNKGAKR